MKVMTSNDPREFVYKTMMEQNLDPQETLVKVGLDDGQQTFKITVQSNSNNRGEHKGKESQVLVMHYGLLLLVQTS